MGVPQISLTTQSLSSTNTCVPHSHHKEENNMCLILFHCRRLLSTWNIETLDSLEPQTCIQARMALPSVQIDYGASLCCGRALGMRDILCWLGNKGSCIIFDLEDSHMQVYASEAWSRNYLSLGEYSKSYFRIKKTCWAYRDSELMPESIRVYVGIAFTCYCSNVQVLLTQMRRTDSVQAPLTQQLALS